MVMHYLLTIIRSYGSLNTRCRGYWALRGSNPYEGGPSEEPKSSPSAYSGKGPQPTAAIECLGWGKVLGPRKTGATFPPSFCLGRPAGPICFHGSPSFRGLLLLPERQTECSPGNLPKHVLAAQKRADNGLPNYVAALDAMREAASVLEAQAARITELEEGRAYFKGSVEEFMGMRPDRRD